MKTQKKNKLIKEIKNLEEKLYFMKKKLLTEETEENDSDQVLPSKKLTSQDDFLQKINELIKKISSASRGGDSVKDVAEERNENCLLRI